MKRLSVACLLSLLPHAPAAAQLQFTKLLASDGEADDRFGVTVATNGRLVAAGAPFADVGGDDAGAAYIFRGSGADWTEQAKLVATDGAAGDLFGSAVDLGRDLVVLGAPQAEDPDRILERLQSDARVESAQPMNLFETSSGLYNDPYLELQHGVSSMQVEEAHRWARGTGIEVAVVDTVVDIEHPELRDHIRLARDFVRADGRVPTPDRHGTAVTGVIVSAVDNGLGIIGVAPAAKILALQGCWQRDPKSAQGTCSSFTLAKALAFAVEQQPDILNLSLAGPHDPLLERLVRTALADDIVVVAAVGDSPAKPFPASVAGVMGVRAIPQAGDGAASTSDRDELLAPGADIITTSPAGGFDFHSGHSLATAHVSGLIALLLERRPGLRAAELQELLRDTSVPVARLEASPGPPMVNACAALARLVAGPTCALD